MAGGGRRRKKRPLPAALTEDADFDSFSLAGGPSIVSGRRFEDALRPSSEGDPLHAASPPHQRRRSTGDASETPCHPDILADIAAGCVQTLVAGWECWWLVDVNW